MSDIYRHHYEPTIEALAIQLFVDQTDDEASDWFLMEFEGKKFWIDKAETYIDALLPSLIDGVAEEMSDHAYVMNESKDIPNAEAMASAMWFACGWMHGKSQNLREKMN